MQEDHGYEQEQAKVVQAAKAALRDALGPQSGRRELIEDEAKAVMERNPAERKAVARLLSEYTTAVNRLWLYAENTGITGRLTSAWMKANRKNLAGVAKADYSAEATFTMRAVVCNYLPGKTPLAFFAFQRIAGALTDMRNKAGEFESLPRGTAESLVDDVTPESVLVAKRHLASEGI